MSAVTPVRGGDGQAEIEGLLVTGMSQGLRHVKGMHRVHPTGIYRVQPLCSLCVPELGRKVSLSLVCRGPTMCTIGGDVHDWPCVSPALCSL